MQRLILSELPLGYSLKEYQDVLLLIFEPQQTAGNLAINRNWNEKHVIGLGEDVP